MMPAHIPAVVADLLRDGHPPKWIALVLRDRTDMTKDEIAEAMGVTRKEASAHIAKARQVAITGKDRMEATWTRVDSAFVSLNALHQTRKAA